MCFSNYVKTEPTVLSLVLPFKAMFASPGTDGLQLGAWRVRKFQAVAMSFPKVSKVCDHL